MRRYRHARQHPRQKIDPAIARGVPTTTVLDAVFLPSLTTGLHSSLTWDERGSGCAIRGCGQRSTTPNTVSKNLCNGSLIFAARARVSAPSQELTTKFASTARSASVAILPA